jgi:hypothetical protein
MTTQTQLPPQATKGPATAKVTQRKALDAVSAVADLNQRVAGEFIEFSAAAALETVRTMSELQSALFDSLRREAKSEPVEVTNGQPREPLAWYRRVFETAVEDTQRMTKLMETNAQILTRSVERRQASTERASKDFRDALSTCADRIRDIYGRD